MIKTMRDFQNVYITAQQIEKGQIGVNKEVDGKMVFTPTISPKSALGWAAQRFCEKNKSHFTKMNDDINDIGYKLCLLDKDTKEIMYNTADEKGIRQHGIHEFRFTKDQQKIYEKELSEFFTKPLDFEVESYICPDEKLPKDENEKTDIPIEFELMNGYIFQHQFRDEF